MDVVRTNVEKIGGKVEVDSRVGRGTTLRLRIPLTLAIIPALIVRSLNQSFALPQAALSEVVHIPPEQAATAFECESAQKKIVLHVARSNLKDVHVSAHHLDLRRIHHLADNEKVELVRGFANQLHPFRPCLGTHKVKCAA